MSLGTSLFVYGTLKRGGELHSELAAQKVRYMGLAKIQGCLFPIEGESYPGAIQTDSEEYIKGELYELEEPAKTLARIDEVEECNQGLFVRKLVDCWLGSRKIKAWAYFYAKPVKRNPQIASGHFPVKLRTKTAQ
ncbi:MAG TPA: gamma-glutamylcyclotransferase family protein [Candidatus Angelobacter sp.]|jgi:gamma-glutamylcyclotransferase (GGCT)/AIG2-like uncharacterized protein YtfP|nr:gamma-glutamylcyclotransferase family protein [Candidatus Angelobacter sp.]